MLASYAAGDDATSQTQPNFERDIWPKIVKNCLACHGMEKPKGDLDLRTVNSMRRGGESGPAIDETNPDESLLLQKIAAGEMPPDEKQKLTSDEVELFRRWIRAGLPADQSDVVPPPPPLVTQSDRQFWSFRKLERPALPDVKNAGRVRTPIDLFVLAKLEAKGLTFSPDADRVTLMRRVYLDLIGLPPAPEDVDEYLTDNAPDAYERLVDRLLASPRFGERWGRHWLDIAGYTDTVGFDVDATLIILSEGKWRYRDYVIHAMNIDKPFNRFVTEQLAGDELYDWRHADHFTPEMFESLIATGFLRTARDLTHEDVGVIPQNYYGILNDTLEIVGTGLLGLTINCARCHDHKFDPIPQEDYYRLMAIFTPAYNPNDWRCVIPTETKKPDRSLPDISRSEEAAAQQHNQQIDAQVAALKQQSADLRRPYEERLLATKLEIVPQPIRDDVKSASATQADKRSEVQKYLFEKFGASIAIKEEEVTAILSEADAATKKQLDTQIAAANSQRRTWGKVQTLFDLGPPPPTYLLMRGNYETPGAEVAPGFLRVLCKSDFSLDACR